MLFRFCAGSAGRNGGLSTGLCMKLEPDPIAPNVFLTFDGFSQFSRDSEDYPFNQPTAITTTVIIES